MRSGRATPRVPAGARADEGFTLVEIVIALVLLTTIMASMGALFIKGVRHSSDLQRRQAAVTLAQQVLEAVRGVPVAPAGGCVKLLQGRTPALVDPQWNAAPAGFKGVTDEATSSCGGVLVVPLDGLPVAAGTARSAALGSLPYTVQTYIGTCMLTTATPSACVRSAAAPATAATLYRVLVRVSWSGSGCTAATCEYSASTLLDPSTDPLFNVRAAAAPVATADTFCLPSGGPGTINVVANDTGSLGPTPVTVVAAPGKGVLSAGIRSGAGGYTPNAGASGTDTFTYYLTDVNGVLSSTVTATVKIGGCT